MTKKASNTPRKPRKPKVELPKPDYGRHMSVFDPAKHGGMLIHVVGAGATGSRISLELAKMGCNNINVWDFDKVEAHNLPNQVYGPCHVGWDKVDALKDVCRTLAGVEINAHSEAYTGNDTETESPVGKIVFLLTDTMKSRKDIWKNLQRRLGMQLLIETRMGIEQGKVYTIEPTDDPAAYADTFCEDDQAEESACGSRTVVGPTAAALAGHAIWSMLEFLSGKKPPMEIDFTLRNGRMTIENQKLHSKAACTTATAKSQS